MGPGGIERYSTHHSVCDLRQFFMECVKNYSHKTVKSHNRVSHKYCTEVGMVITDGAYGPPLLSHPQIPHLQAVSGPKYPQNREYGGFWPCCGRAWLYFSASWGGIGSWAPYASIHVQWMAPPSPHRPLEAQTKCTYVHSFTVLQKKHNWLII